MVLYVPCIYLSSLERHPHGSRRESWEQAGPPRGSASITAVTVHKGGILSNTLKEHSREPPRSQAAHESSPGKMVQVR